jgi:glycosyltransferase involved in cell wall biosynthesis
MLAIVDMTLPPNEGDVLKRRVAALFHAMADFLKSDPALYSLYLLHSQDDQDFRADTPESYLAFVLWFLVHGRHRYRYPLVIPDRLKDLISFPNEDGRHLLAGYLASQRAEFKRDLGENFNEELAWYYFEALPKYHLAPLLSGSELARLGSGDHYDRLVALSGVHRGTSKKEDLTGEDRPATSSFLRDRLKRLSRANVESRNLPSVSIVGFHRSVLGLGEDARCLFECLLDAGVRSELIDVSPPSLERHPGAGDYAAFEAELPTAPVVIFCMPAFEMMRVIASHVLAPPNRRQYRIGYWPWETDELPANWRHAYSFVDEIWASSKFLRDVYGRQTTKPVIYMPLHIEVADPLLPDEFKRLFETKFTFLSIFDFNSRIERKFPLGAIKAFQTAFSNSRKNVQLVLKTLHCEMRPRDFEPIRKAIDDDARIVLVDGPLSKAEVCGLVAASDAYLSLHRAEGFGRPVAEAMLLGTPVIVTNWSGPCDFLNRETGFPINSYLRPVGSGEYPFAAGRWAEPDLDHAAAVMRDLCEKGHAPESMIERAKATVSESFSRSRIAERLRDHLSKIPAGL